MHDTRSFVLRPDGPRHRNATAPGAISLRSMAPAKVAYAVTGILIKIVDGKLRMKLIANTNLKNV